MIRTWKQLRELGTPNEFGCVRIQCTAKGHKFVAIEVWPDNSATRADYGMDLTICTKIRTVKECLKILHLVN